MARNPIPNYVASYIQRRIDEGAFTAVDAQLAARGFLGMFASYVLFQEILGWKKKQLHDDQEVVRTFVAIFLKGVQNPDCARGSDEL
jgi:hypothetical protein